MRRSSSFPSYAVLIAGDFGFFLIIFVDVLDMKELSAMITTINVACEAELGGRCLLYLGEHGSILIWQ